MSIEMQNPEGVAGKVDAAWNYVEQIGLALSIGDIAHAKRAKIEAARLLSLATDELNDEDETDEHDGRMIAELERWRSLPAKVEALISQTNIPLSAAAVRTTAINQVLDLIDEIRRAENADNVRTSEAAPE
jgi:hypothetical protein